MIKSRRLSWVGNVAWLEKGRSTFKILTGKHTGRILLGRPRHRWKQNIRMNLLLVLSRGIILIWHRIGIIGNPL